MRAFLKAHLDKKIPKKISGIIFSGGIIPDMRTSRMLKQAGIATLVSENDTYIVASNINSIVVKIKPQDKAKIGLIVDLIEEYVDIGKVIANLL